MTYLYENVKSAKSTRRRIRAFAPERIFEVKPDIFIEKHAFNKMTLNARDPHDLNIDPNIWGPHLWATMHTLALRADADRENLAFGNFLNSLHFLLPCNRCKDDYSKYVNTNGYPLTNEAFAWTVNFHNYVNTKLGKNYTLSVDEAKALWYSDSCSYSCKQDKQTKHADQVAFALLGLVLVVCFLFLYKCLISK